MYFIITEEIVSPEHFVAFLNSKAAKTALEASCIASGGGKVPRSQVLAARNYILVNVLLSNGCRAGVLLAIQHHHLKEMKLDKNGVMTITVNTKALN